MRSDEITNARFRTTTFDPGYEPAEVDAFLDEAVSTLRLLETGERGASIVLDATRVADVRFTATRFRSGYHQEDVDAFLDRLAEVFRAHELDAIARRPEEL